ncbi:ABC transporter ATP-binding protein [Clostridium polynesiense]|uniref:ABC transporter ATP-binding protein n=1 Tax=Clostridium polynesiense TaxID=1325933 RepID=UPI0005913EA1|nr:ABC transporter ATP-binding protein [Clostridium polynesiense]
MYSIKFENVSKSFGKTKVINNLNLNIKKGERMILLGQSGCGKSTILRMISGLETITSGDLYLNGERANDIDSGDRSIAMVFQNYALFPHMTITENIGYGLKINKEKKEVIKERVDEAVRILNLEGLEGRYPRELSGGQRQRVALARALVKRGDFFLLDEPLSNLDAQLRGHARKELVKIHEMYKQTFIYVTHDQVEAMTIGDRIALMNQGDLQMLDTPHNVYHRPSNIFVATFIGSPSMNIIPVNIEGNELIIGDNRIKLPEIWLKHINNSGSKKLKMGIRPEDVVLSATPGEYSLPVEIKYIEDYGNRIGFYFNIHEDEVISIMSEGDFSRNAKVYWNVKVNKLHFFDSETTNSIGYPSEIK